MIKEAAVTGVQSDPSVWTTVEKNREFPGPLHHDDWQYPHPNRYAMGLRGPVRKADGELNVHDYP